MVRPWISRAAVFVCPIVDGGGTKLKILDAMAMGKPIVSTSIGCEGLDVSHGETILVADAPQDFASMVTLALENESLRERLIVAVRALVEEKYSWEIVGSRLDQTYESASRKECSARSADERLHQSCPQTRHLLGR